VGKGFLLLLKSNRFFWVEEVAVAAEGVAFYQGRHRRAAKQGSSDFLSASFKFWSGQSAGVTSFDLVSLRHFPTSKKKPSQKGSRLRNESIVWTRRWKAGAKSFVDFIFLHGCMSTRGLAMKSIKSLSFNHDLKCMALFIQKIKSIARLHDPQFRVSPCPEMTRIKAVIVFSPGLGQVIITDVLHMAYLSSRKPWGRGETTARRSAPHRKQIMGETWGGNPKSHPRHSAIEGRQKEKGEIRRQSCTKIEGWPVRLWGHSAASCMHLSQYKEHKDMWYASLRNILCLLIILLCNALDFGATWDNLRCSSVVGLHSLGCATMVKQTYYLLQMHYKVEWIAMLRPVCEQLHLGPIPTAFPCEVYHWLLFHLGSVCLYFHWLNPSRFALGVLDMCLQQRIEGWHRGEKMPPPSAWSRSRVIWDESDCIGQTDYTCRASLSGLPLDPNGSLPSQTYPNWLTKHCALRDHHHLAEFPTDPWSPFACCMSENQYMYN
jgi:hypothetical protein